MRHTSHGNAKPWQVATGYQNTSRHSSPRWEQDEPRFHWRNVFYAALVIGLGLSFHHAMKADQRQLCQVDGPLSQGCR